jgi:hypothetical protein
MIKSSAIKSCKNSNHLHVTSEIYPVSLGASLNHSWQFDMQSAVSVRDVVSQGTQTLTVLSTEPENRRPLETARV